jgi:hypothetical protein
MSKEKEKEAVIDWLRRSLANANAALKNFSEKFANNQNDTLYYLGDETFRYAARKGVIEKVLETLNAKDSKATFETMRNYALLQIVRGTSRKRSTNRCADILEEEEIAAWATVYEALQ